jgi:drug/metabolite transporter (DMT)-like permease
MHAGWNAVVKGGGDPLLSIAHMAIAGSVTAGLGLLFVPVPMAAAWPWLIASVVLHTGYRYALIKMYSLGDLGHVYPLARGAAPFLTALITLAWIGERLAAIGYLGIAALGIGVALLTLKGGRRGGLDANAAGAALITSLWISAYSFADGHGARINGHAASFALWLFALNCVCMVAWGHLARGPALWSTFQASWPTALSAAIISQLAYFIAIWAMTKAPIALVAALRETSVLFALLISVLVLREPLTRWRMAAGTILVAGAMLLRLG